jgi:hypothetical protein
MPIPSAVVTDSRSEPFFQATPIFKQIPGTDYIWHDVALLVAPGGNHNLVREKMSAVVDSVYAEYRKNIERQHDNIERRIEAKLKTPIPEAKVQAAEGGVEVAVRYPVEGGRASEIDGRIVHAISEMLSHEADLKAQTSGLPKIRLVTRPVTR